jgi:hypothetical protein
MAAMLVVAPCDFVDRLTYTTAAPEYPTKRLDSQGKASATALFQALLTGSQELPTRRDEPGGPANSARPSSEHGDGEMTDEADDRIIIPYPVEENARCDAARRIEKLASGGYRGYFDRDRDAFVFVPADPPSP